MSDIRVGGKMFLTIYFITLQKENKTFWVDFVVKPYITIFIVFSLDEVL